MPDPRPDNEVPTILVDGAMTMWSEDEIVVTLFYEDKPVAKLDITPEALERIIGGLKGPPTGRH